MSNPLTLASPVTFPKGPGGSPDNLTALAIGQAKALGTLGTANVQYYDDYVAPIRIRTGASGVDPQGTVDLYLIMSEDNAVWTDAIDPNSGADQAALLITARKIQTIAAGANATTYYFDEFSIASILGFVPTFWSLVVKNNTLATFDVTVGNFYAKHSLVGYA